MIRKKIAMISETILPIKKRLYCLLQVWGPSQLFKNIRQIYKDDVSVGFHCTLRPKDIIFFLFTLNSDTLVGEVFGQQFDVRRFIKCKSMLRESIKLFLIKMFKLEKQVNEFW